MAPAEWRGLGLQVELLAGRDPHINAHLRFAASCHHAATLPRSPLLTAPLHLPLGAASTAALEAAVVELQRDLDALQVLPPAF